MKTDMLRNASLPALLAGGFILLDLALDRYLGDPGRLDWPHLILAVSVMLVSYILMSRAVGARSRAEAVLRQARDEMESRVRQRTTELEQANEALRTEVAERKRVEQALRTSEETARALMNSSSESALLLDAQGVVLASNETAARRLGVSVERLMASSLFDFFPPEVTERRRTYLDAISHSRQPLHFVDERDDRTFDNHVYPVFDAEGRIIRLAVFGQDVTERKRAEEALRESEGRYRTLFDNFPEPTTVWGSDGVLVLQNVVSARNLGGKREDYLGKTIYDLFGEAAGAYMERIVRVIDTGESEEQEDVVELHSGKHYFWTWMQRIQNPDGRHAAQVISYDITKRKRSEEVLRWAQAELAIGTQKRVALEERQRLARELHDSVSQALYGISLGINTALTLFDTDRTRVLEALHYALSLTHAGLTEMRALIFELRPESLEMEGLVVALTKQVDALHARAGIEGNLSLCGEPDVPFAIKEALYRIGREAMHNAVKHARPQRLDVRLAREPEGLCLEVCDNGIGFDPLAAYPGHLGLRSMRERAQSVDGMLEIVSAPGCGTQIRARIPIAAPETA